MKMENISSSALFRGISQADAESVLKCLSAVERTYKKGDIIFHAGDRASAMGLVVSGRVEIVRDDFWGNRQIMGSAGAGELFGESYACMPNAVFMVTAQAAEDCELLFLEVGKILTTCSPACEFHSRLIHNLLYIMSEKNLQLTRKIDHMGKRNIREKVMAYLSFQAEQKCSDSFQIPFNRQQLADYLAVDRSALSAELSRMQKDGILRYEKNYFTIVSESSVSLDGKERAACPEKTKRDN